MSKEEDPSRRPPEDFQLYPIGEVEPSAAKVFAKQMPFLSTGIVLGLGVLAFRMYNVRYRPQYLGRTQELSQYLIYTRLYVCGTVIAGGTGEMFNEFYK